MPNPNTDVYAGIVGLAGLAILSGLTLIRSVREEKKLAQEEQEFEARLDSYEYVVDPTFRYHFQKDFRERLHKTLGEIMDTTDVDW